MHAKDWRFPMACPACTAQTGNPFRAITRDPRTVEIELRCDMCHHHWSLSATSPALFLRPKADRRSPEKKPI